MLINQIPADWYNLVEPINKIWEDLQTTREQLGILTNYVDNLNSRMEKLETYVQKVKTVKENVQKSTHWVTVAKRDLDLIKERRKKEGKDTKLAMNGILLYREVVKFKKLRDQKSPEALKILDKIFKSGN